MVQDIYDPLNEYVNVFRDRFKQVAEQTFAALAAEAKVDVEQNRATCKKIYEAQDHLKSVMSKSNLYKFASVALWIAVAVGAVVCIASYDNLQRWHVAIICAIILLVALYFTILLPRKTQLSDEMSDVQQEIHELSGEAWRQMEPLNRLYDWDVLTRMMAQTVPRLEFDPYFTTKRLADLHKTYGWDDSFNEGRSVIYSHSGLINGNPFIICRTRSMHMSSKTYTGSKTIYWTTRERGSDGKWHTVSHSETLTAEVTAPYPEYPEWTHIIYGNTAAPDLIFNRKQSGLASEKGSFKYNRRLRALRKKARDLENADYAMMTNEDFEVAFDTSNRNNNQQFALLFTPLAQESMMNLLKDEQHAGYGDDFEFNKRYMINSIVPDHLQRINLDMDPDRYKNFDYDRAEKDFYAVNAEYFRAIYFSLAPLLCVPMYQQIRPASDIYGREMPQRSSFWEHEALANFWGDEHFMAPDCATRCILKTSENAKDDGSAVITVQAHGYSCNPRTAYIRKFGGDGRYHNVPVEWDEYLPTVGNGRIEMREDNAADDANQTQSQRLSHINELLTKSNLNVYRRHIASKIS